MVGNTAERCGESRGNFEARSRWSQQVSRIALAVALTAFSTGLAQAESMSGALTKAYGFSPDLNQQRAATRAADEGVPRATAALRPTVTGTSTGGYQWTRVDAPGKAPFKSNTFPRTAGLSVTETLYNGGRTGNTIRQAESTVMQSRETLRLSEQNILSNAATAYMNVLRDTALLKLQENNVQVLQEQLKQTEDRFQVGEVTRTDVAQAQAALAQGLAGAFTARSNLQNSLAVYRQLIGEQPRNLEPARPVEILLPRNLSDAVAASQAEHPSIQAALHAVDVAALNVTIQEGALLPTVTATGTAQYARDPTSSGTPNQQSQILSAVATLTVPIYEGGATYSAIRQAKELLGQARLQADLQREAIRAAVVSAWGAYQNTKLVIQSFQAQVRANEIALNGVREEAKVGQRTTLDVLNAQQTLLNSRVSLIGAQRDQVVNSYALLAAVGRLSSTTLGLGVVAYDPSIHFDQVKGKWIGTRTPDGN